MADVNQFIDEDGKVVQREEKPDDQRCTVLGEVTCVTPLTVRIPDRPDPVPVTAAVVGLEVAVGDFVSIFRVALGLVATAKIEVLA